MSHAGFICLFCNKNSNLPISGLQLQIIVQMAAARS